MLWRAFFRAIRRLTATHRLDAKAELADIQALLGHESVATTPMDTHVRQERMAAVVARL